jgi:uncharacterized membrane protein YeaQ/YmgE (transglycosylase-associated protein family)
MNPNSILGAIIVGLLIGGLGRLAVPGRQPIGCLMTLLIGILGAVGGLAIANAADVHRWFLVLCCQVGVAAVGVLIASNLGHLGRPRPRPPLIR